MNKFYLEDWQFFVAVTCTYCGFRLRELDISFFTEFPRTDPLGTEESDFQPQCPVKTVDFETMTPVPPDPAGDLGEEGPEPRWWQYRVL